MKIDHFHKFAFILYVLTWPQLVEANCGVPYNPVATTLFGDIRPGVITDLSYYVNSPGHLFMKNVLFFVLNNVL